MYYKLNHDLSAKVVGRSHPQVDCLTIFQAQFLDSDHLYNPKPKLKYKLRKSAKLTDVINEDSAISKASGLLINKKVKSILLRYNLMRHQYIETSLELSNGDILQYYWLHLSDPDLITTIDFPNSILYRTEWTFRKEDIVKLDSFDDYKKMKKMKNIEEGNLSFGVKFEQIVFSERFNRSLDMFAFLPLDSSIYISQNLKNELVENQITGLLFEEANNIIS